MCQLRQRRGSLLRSKKYQLPPASTPSSYRKCARDTRLLSPSAAASGRPAPFAAPINNLLSLSHFSPAMTRALLLLLFVAVVAVLGESDSSKQTSKKLFPPGMHPSLFPVLFYFPPKSVQFHQYMTISGSRLRPRRPHLHSRQRTLRLLQLQSSRRPAVEMD